MPHIANAGGQVFRQVPQVPAGERPADLQSRSQSAGSAFFPVLLTDEQAAACLGVSVRKFHDLRSESWMPRPVILGPRLLRWPRSELERAITDMPRQGAVSPEPTQLLRSRIERAKRTGSLAVPA